jgi:hypothetical protein
MLTPQAQAMVQGMQQGNKDAQSILPSAYQPQGRAQPRNRWEGVLNMINTHLLEVAAGVGQQGQQFRDQVEKLYKLAYELKKLNNQLTDIAVEGTPPQSSQPQQQTALPFYQGDQK